MAAPTEGRTGAASVTVPGAPGHWYEVVSDLPNMRRWSPETRGGRWIHGATGAAVGAKFRGWNKRGWFRWFSYCRVIADDPGREFAFRVTGPPPMAHVTWRYRFEQRSETETAITESWELPRPLDPARRLMLRLFLGSKNRPEELTEGIRHTLAELSASGSPRSGTPRP